MNYICHKELLSKIHKGVLQINPTTQLQNRQGTWIDISPKWIRIANKHKNIYSMSSKTMTYHLTLSRDGNYKNKTQNKKWLLKKLKIKLLCASAIPFLVRIGKKGLKIIKSRILKRYFTPIFKAGLFTITKWWKEPKCLSRNEQRSNICYTYKIDYFSVLKRNNPTTYLCGWAMRMLL